MNILYNSHSRYIFMMFTFCIFWEEPVLSKTDSITIQDALHRMIITQPQIKQAQLSSESIIQTIDRSRSAYFPTINGHINYSFIEPVYTIPVGGKSVPFQPPNNFNFYGELRQNIFDFGRRSKGVALARNSFAQSQTSLRNLKSDLIYQTVNTFYSLLFLYRNIDVQNDEIDVLDKHLEATQKLVASGSATTYDILTVKVRIAESKTTLIETKGQLLKTETVLNYLVNGSDSITLIPRGDFLVPVLFINTDSLIEVALRQSPSMQTARQREQAAALQYDLAKAAYLPQIGFDAQGGFKNGIIPDINRLRGYYTLSSQLVITFFDGLELRAAAKEARLNHRAAIENLQSTTQSVEQSVHEAIINFLSANAVFLEVEPQVQLADTTYSMAQIRYKAGVITSVDLLDAQTRKRQAHLQQIQAEYRLKTAYYELRQVVGDTLGLLNFR